MPNEPVIMDDFNSIMVLSCDDNLVNREEIIKKTLVPGDQFLAKCESACV